MSAQGGESSIEDFVKFKENFEYENGLTNKAYSKATDNSEKLMLTEKTLANTNEISSSTSVDVVSADPDSSNAASPLPPTSATLFSNNNSLDGEGNQSKEKFSKADSDKWEELHLIYIGCAIPLVFIFLYLIKRHNQGVRDVEK